MHTTVPHPPLPTAEDGSPGRWRLCLPLRQFDFKLDKKVSGAAAIPDRLINWVVNSAVPK
jgi:hypothetical protein